MANSKIPYVGQRIKELLHAHNMTQTTLAEGIGVSAAFLSQVISGKRKASIPLLENIANFMDTPLYLFFFEEKKIIGNKEFLSLYRFFHECNALNAEDLDALVPFISFIKEKNTSSVKPDEELFSPLPLQVLFSTTKKHASPLNNDILTVDVPRRFSDPTRFKTVQVVCNAMAPLIEQNDHVVVEKNSLPLSNSPSFVCANINKTKQYFIRNFHSEEENIVLRALNPDFEPIIFPKEQLISVEKIIHILK